LLTARIAKRAVAVTVALLAGLLFVEGGLRLLDGYRLSTLALQPRQAIAAPPASTGRADRKYIGSIATAPGIDRAWYEREPPRRPEAAGPDDQLRQRAARYPSDPLAASYVFNRRYLQEAACGRSGQPLPPFDDFFFFETPDGSPYPTYRLLPHVSLSSVTTNNFGFRGHDVAVARPAGIIRLAFVGASTTLDSFAAPFSHPELVEYWLNRWAAASHRPFAVEVVNAGRSGIDSRSIAAIVRQEILPLDPDLVVFYEGANQFWPGQLLNVRFGRLFPKPDRTFRRRTPADDYSALVRRSLNLFDRFKGGDGREPRKPPYTVQWPAGVDERDPDVFSAALPMDLHAVVSNLDDMRTSLQANGSDLAVSSFIWLVHDGMRLDLTRHLAIHRQLNDTYWPVSYTLMRRMADFQNRVFEKYARVRKLPYIDIAGRFPQDPDLFDDAIHLNYDGLRLQAWLFVQALAPIVAAHVDAGAWPRPAPPKREVHPAFSQTGRRLVTAAEIRAHC
jgi:hypothetical protein